MIARLTFRSLLSRKARIVLTALSVIVGVAFVSGAFILTDSFKKAFDGLFTELNQGVDYRVRGTVAFGDEGQGDPVPASLVQTFRDIPGVGAVEPNLQGSAVIIDQAGKPVKARGGPQLGVSWSGESSIGGTVLRTGRAPNGPGEVVVDAETADRSNLAVGDRIQVVGSSGALPYQIVGTVGLRSGDNSFFGATLVAFDPATAQQVLDSPGLFDSIDIAVADGADPGQVEQAVQQAIPDGTEVITGQQVAKETSDQIGQIVSIFRWVLLGFAMVALFVSAFLINNTFQIIISQRLRELALLRAVGASGHQVRSMILLESFIVAAVATVLGFFGGIGVSKLLVVVFNAVGAGFPEASTVIQPRTILFTVLVGFGVTLMATIIPALRASRIPPVAAMRPELAAVGRTSNRRRYLGGALTVGGLAVYIEGIIGKPGGTLAIIIFAAVGAIAMFLGVTILASSFAGPVARVLGKPVAKLFKVPGQLAAQNASRSPRRTSSTASALMIGVALVASVGVIGSSLKQSFSQQLEQSIKADFFITDPSFQGFPPTVVTELAALPELSATSGFRASTFQVDGGSRSVGAVDGAEFGEIVDMDITSGGYDGLADNGLLVYKDPAKDFDLQVGDTVDVLWQNGTQQTLTVRGIFADASTTNTNWIVDASVFAAGNPTVKNDFFAGARITDGVSPQAARAAVQTVVDKFPQVELQDRAEFRKSQEDQLNQLLFLIYGLLAFAVVIAVLGIMNTLALSVFERTREFGLLRAVGTSKRQLRRAVRWEAVIVSVFGAILGLVVGLPLGIIATKGMKGIGINSVALPVGTIIAILVLAVLAGMIAAMWPARRAAKLDVLEAIATT